MSNDDDDKMQWKPPYSIRATSTPTRPGCWNTNAVEVLGPDGAPVGSYEYGYHGAPPFYPFEIAGQWYALYSRNYTATSIMRLPSCDDVWSEKPGSAGFCPVEFYVPAYQNLDFGGDRTNKFKGTILTDADGFRMPHHDARHDWTYRPVVFHDFGFVCGCVWGDDSSWKVQFFDFSKIADGIVTYDSRFGYFELHPKLKLAESVRIWGSHTDRSKLRIELTGQRAFTFDGKDEVDEAA